MTDTYVIDVIPGDVAVIGYQSPTLNSLEIILEGRPSLTGVAGITTVEVASAGPVLVTGGGTTLRGSLAPEGNVAAAPGMQYQQDNGMLYLKTIGTGTTGWEQLLAVHKGPTAPLNTDTLWIVTT